MNIFPRSCLIGSLLFLGVSWTSYGQTDSLSFEHLKTQHGLSQNSVWSICQDREGFMWFDTQDGLNKYDGYTFTIFKPDPRDPNYTLQNNIITDIHEDRKGRLWVATWGGCTRWTNQPATLPLIAWRRIWV